MTLKSTAFRNVVLENSPEGVCHVQLARPEKLNAMDGDMIEELIQVGPAIEAQKNLRCVVISGQGRSFCAGIDKGLFLGTAKPVGDLVERSHGDCNIYQQVVMQFRRLPVPVIVAIHGVCFGAGMALASGGDIRIAAPDARLAIREIHWGLMPDMAAFVVWKDLLRNDQLRSLIYTGRELAGETALELGLVTQVSASPLDEALRMAEDIAMKNPDAIRQCKALFELARDASTDEILHRESLGQQAILGSSNQREAVTSQLEKRKPNFL